MTRISKLFIFLVSTFIPASLVAADKEWVSVTDTGIPYKEATITTEEGTWMSVDVSPDGQTIAFDMLGDIYTMPASGGEATLIMGGSALDRQPRFSPDGKQLVFTSDRSGMFNIWVSDTEGKNPRQISAETGSKLSYAVWAPDGQYIAAMSVGAGFPKPEWFGTIDMYHINGGAGRMIAKAVTPGPTIQEPTFSKDGEYLFHTETMGRVSWDADANQPNYVVKQLNLKTGKKETIIQGFGSAVSPQVSPDGKRITFIRRVKDKTALFVYDRETRRETPLYDKLSFDVMASPGQDGYYPLYSWFPDNKSVAIWAKGKILKINVDTATASGIPFKATATHRISQVTRYKHKDLAPENFTVQTIQQVTTSPDGSTIVFSALGSLWQKKLPNGVPSRLTKGTDFEYEPHYSPDGKKVVYVTWDDENGGAVKTISARGGKVKTVATSSGAMRAPVWSIDQKKIAWFIDTPEDSMAGYRAEPGIYWTKTKGGKATWVGAGEYPLFSQSDNRIYYNLAKSSKSGGGLNSRRLDGLDERLHVKSPVAKDFRLSPDGKWLAFSQYKILYIVPYTETGTAINIHKDSRDAKVARVSKHAGWSAHWSIDDGSLNWMLGDEYYRSTPEDLFSLVSSAELQETGIEVGLTAKTDIPEGVIAFTNGRIITMENDQVIESGSVVVEGNRIVAVGENIDIPVDAKIIDLQGKTIMPGLIDMHGHLLFGRDSLVPEKHPAFYAAAAFGVTTNFDVATSDFTASTSRDLIQSGRIVGPRYLTTGRTTLGPQGSSAHVMINSVDDARSHMRRKKELGFSAIKSYRHPKRMQKQKLIKAALESNIMVMPEGEFNVYNRVGMILDGHTTIEHNGIMRTYHDDLIKLFAAGETAMTPTLVVSGGGIFGENYFYETTKPWEDPKIKTFVKSTFSQYSPFHQTPSQPVWVRSMKSLKMDESLWEILYKEAARSMKKLNDAGVLINTGGHGQINGLALHWDMWLLSSGGMTEMEVLRAATMNPARTLGLEEQVGSIRVGKLADLIILDKNPLDNIRNTNSVRYTMMNGRLYDSYSMNEIGNYNRPRTKFFWERPNYNGVDWNETESGVDRTKFEDTLPHRH